MVKCFTTFNAQCTQYNLERENLISVGIIVFHFKIEPIKYRIDVNKVKVKNIPIVMQNVFLHSYINENKTHILCNFHSLRRKTFLVKIYIQSNLS